jgi:hypothetical protein
VCICGWNFACHAKLFFRSTLITFSADRLANVRRIEPVGRDFHRSNTPQAAPMLRGITFSSIPAKYGLRVVRGATGQDANCIGMIEAAETNKNGDLFEIDSKPIACCGFS